MFAVRFLVLLFFAVYGWKMGQFADLNAFGTFIAFSFFITAPALYVLPTYEAWKNGHANLTAIALVNILLGWSVVGWVVAVVWAFKKSEPTEIAAPDAIAATPQNRATKRCPYCAEDVLVQAIKCKHCGSALTGAPT